MSWSADLVDRLLASGPPAVLYQPVVDLAYESTPVVGYEALARWPAVDGVSTDSVFDQAREQDRIVELDQVCSGAAINGALAAGIDADTAIFVNVEPATTVRPVHPRYRRPWQAALRRLTLVLELTERRLLDNAAPLLDAIDVARAGGALVAVDDVGVNPQSLAMLEFIRPDMVKLDLGFVQRPIDADAARTLRGVAAYVERTGADLIAEGIETEEHLERAIGIGATLGQGYLFGRPGVIRPATTPFRPHRVAGLDEAATPYRLISERRGYRIARRSVLDRLSADIERQAAEMRDPPVVLIALRPQLLTAAGIATRWSGLAERAQMMVLAGRGVTIAPIPGVRGAAIADDDPLRGEAAIVVLGTHGAIALAAQSLGPDDPDDPGSGEDDPADGVPEERLRYVMTQDHDLVAAAGLALLRRVDSTNAGYH